MTEQTKTVKRIDLITYERMAEIIADVADSKNPRVLLRAWRQREFIVPVRPDLAVFEWSKVRPILAARLGQGPDAWIDEPADPSSCSLCGGSKSTTQKVCEDCHRARSG